MSTAPVPETVDPQLARQLREAREQAGLSREQLGALIGVSREQVSRIEGGRRGTSPARVRQWMEACEKAAAAGGVPLLVERSAVLVAPEATSRVVVMLDLTSDDRDVFERLLRIWPRLEPSNRRILAAQLSAYERELAAATSTGKPPR